MGKKSLTRHAILIPVLAAYAYDEISIGRARELLHMPDDRIKEEAERRVSNEMKRKERRDAVDSLLTAAIAIMDERGRRTESDTGYQLGDKDWARLRKRVFDALELL